MTLSPALELLQRRLDELVALLSIYCKELACEGIEPEELLPAVQEATFDATSYVHLTSSDMRLTLAATLPSWDADRDNHSIGSADGGCCARLHLLLPSDYPTSGPAQVLAVTCDLVGRQDEDRCRSNLQQLADAAAAPAPAGGDGSGRAPPRTIGAAEGAGQECLCQLVDCLLEYIQQVLVQQQEQQQARDGSTIPNPPEHGSTVSGATTQQGQELALLRLDHMHSRTTYSRTIRRWAAELGLTGRLLFCGGGGVGSITGIANGGGGVGRSVIILVLLLGPADAVREYLVRQRTRCVDVDSKGRPCKERMLNVVCNIDWPTGNKALRSSRDLCLAPDASSFTAGGAAARPSSSGHTSDRTCSSSKGSAVSPHAAAFSDFREEELDVRQLAALLRKAGLEAYWTAATGFPGPPPASGTTQRNQLQHRVPVLLAASQPYRQS